VPVICSALANAEVTPNETARLKSMQKHSRSEHDREGYEFYSCRKSRKINLALASEEGSL